MGSTSELEYLLLLASDLGYIPVGIYEPMQDDLVELKILNTFIQKLRAQG